MFNQLQLTGCMMLDYTSGSCTREWNWSVFGKHSHMHLWLDKYFQKSFEMIRKANKIILNEFPF